MTTLNNSVPLSLPYYQYVHLGEPVFNGQVFVGIANNDPLNEENRIDIPAVGQGGTTTILKQPINLNESGLAVDDTGKVVYPIVDQDYAITVLDQNGELIYEEKCVSVPNGESRYTEITTVPVEVTKGQTQISIPDSPNNIVLVVDSDVQQSDIDYVYEREKAIATVTTPFTGNERVFYMFGAIVPISPPNPNITDKGYVTYEDFDADLTGVIPADDAIINTHNFANENNLPVKQNSGVIYWQNKTATVKTPTDLTGLTIRVDTDSGTKSATFSQPGIYEIDREYDLIKLDQATINQLNTTYKDSFKVGAMSLPSDIFDQYGVCEVICESSVDDIIRFPQQTSNKRIDCSIKSRAGVLNQPWYKDLSGTLTNVTIVKASNSWLKFKMPKIKIEENVGGFRVVLNRRPQTTISGLIVEETGFTPVADTVRELVECYQCFDIKFKNFRSPAMNLTGNSNYGITVGTVVNATYERINATGGWGFTTGNFCKNLTYDNCEINRIDIHNQVFNVTIKNTTMFNWAARFSGGGRLLIENCQYNLSANLSGLDGSILERTVVRTSQDYGAEWDGSIEVIGCNVVVDAGRIATDGKLLLDIVRIYPNSENHDYGRPMVMGRSITVKDINIYFSGTQANSDNFDSDVYCVNFGGLTNKAQDQFYPTQITVDNVKVISNPDKVYISAYNAPNYLASTCKGLVDATRPSEGDANHYIYVENMVTGLNSYQTATPVDKNSKQTVVFKENYDNADSDYLNNADRLRPYVRVSKVDNFSMVCAIKGNFSIENSTITTMTSFGDGQNNNVPEGDVYLKIDSCDVKLRSNTSSADSFNFPRGIVMQNSRLLPARKRDESIASLDFATFSDNSTDNVVHPDTVVTNLPPHFIVD